MNYYLIKQDKRARNIVKPQLNNKSEIWRSDNPIFIPVSVHDKNDHAYFLPFLEEDIFFISDNLKKIFENYQNNTLYRACALGIIDAQAIKVYWLMQPKIIDCLLLDRKDNIIYSYQEIVLSRSKIGYNKVFQIDTVVGNYLIMDEEVLERCLREGINEFEWTEVQVLE